MSGDMVRTESSAVASGTVYIAPLGTPLSWMSNTQIPPPVHNDLAAHMAWNRPVCGQAYLIRKPADGEDDTDLWRTCARPVHDHNDPHGYWLPAAGEDEVGWCGTCGRVICTPGCAGEPNWVEIGFVNDTDPLNLRAGLEYPLDEALFTGTVGGWSRDRSRYLAEQRISFKVTNPDALRLLVGGDAIEAPVGPFSLPETPAKPTLRQRIKCWLRYNHEWYVINPAGDLQRCSLCSAERFVD